MAIALRAAGTPNVSSGTSVGPISKPTGTVQDDLIVALIYAASAITAVPSGWTLLDDSNYSGGNHLASYYKVCGASEPGTWTWTQTSSANWGGAAVSYSGTATVSPLDVKSTPNVLTTTTSITGTTVTTTQANDLLILFGKGGTAAGAVTPASGMTEEIDANITATRITIDDLLDAGAAGATGDKTATGGSGTTVGSLAAFKIGAGPVTATTTVGTAAAAGGSQTAVVGTTGITTASNAAAAGGSQTAFSSATGVTTKSNAAASGGVQTALASATGVTTKSNAAAAGGVQNATVSYTGITTKSNAAASGGLQTAAAGVTAITTKSNAAASGGVQSGTIANASSITAGSAAASGGLQTASADVTAALTKGTAAASGGLQTGLAVTNVIALLTAGSASAAGGLVTADIFRVAGRYTQLGGNIVQLGAVVPLGYEAFTVKEDFLS